MIAALARALEQAAMRAGRRRTSPAALEAVFARELRSPDMRSAMDALARRLAVTPNVEHAAISQGGRVRASASGTADEVMLPDYAPSGGRATLAHNHPRQHAEDAAYIGGEDAPLSPADMLVGGQFKPRRGADPGFGRIAAIVSDGPILTERGSTARFTAAGRKRMRERKLAEYMNRLAIGGGGLAPRRINAQIEATNRALARLGLIEYGSRYSTADKQRLARWELYMREHEDNLVRAMHRELIGLPYPFRKSHLVGAAAAGAAGATAGAYASSPNRRKRRRRS